MSLLNESNEIIGGSNLTNSTSMNQSAPTIDLEQELEKLALILVQTWKDEHADAGIDADTAYQSCIHYVTTEMAKAGAAVGGPAGLTILTGGGSAAAHRVCRRVL